MLRGIESTKSTDFGVLKLAMRAPRPGDDVGRVPPRSGLQDDDRLHRFAPGVVGDADHRRVGDRRMTEERVLDLGRIDVLAAGHDHVLHPVIDEDVALLVHVGGVAGAHPAVADRGGGRVGLVPVALHHDMGADQDFPDRASRRLLAVGRDDLELDPGQARPQERSLPFAGS